MAQKNLTVLATPVVAAIGLAIGLALGLSHLPAQQSAPVISSDAAAERIPLVAGRTKSWR